MNLDWNAVGALALLGLALTALVWYLRRDTSKPISAEDEERVAAALRAAAADFVPPIDKRAQQEFRDRYVIEAQRLWPPADPRRDPQRPDHNEWVMEAHRPCTDAHCDHPPYLRDRTVHCAYCGERMPCAAIALRAGLDEDSRNLRGDWGRALGGLIPRQQDRSSQRRWW